MTVSGMHWGIKAVQEQGTKDLDQYISNVIEKGEIKANLGAAVEEREFGD